MAMFDYWCWFMFVVHDDEVEWWSMLLSWTLKYLPEIRMIMLVCCWMILPVPIPCCLCAMIWILFDDFEHDEACPAVWNLMNMPRESVWKVLTRWNAEVMLVYVVSCYSCSGKKYCVWWSYFQTTIERKKMYFCFSFRKNQTHSQ